MNEYICNRISSASTTTIFRFWPQDQTRLNTQDVDAPMAYDTFELTHTADANIEVMKTVASAMANPHGGFVVIQDDLGTAYSSDGTGTGSSTTDLRYPAIASTGTAVTVSEVALSI